MFVRRTSVQSTGTETWQTYWTRVTLIGIKQQYGGLIESYVYCRGQYQSITSVLNKALSLTRLGTTVKENLT